MLTPGIISRPVYPGLTLDENAKHNLMAIEGEGAAALLDAVGKAGPDVGQCVLSRSTIIFTPGSSAQRSLDKQLGYDKQLADLKPDALWIFPTLPTAMFRLRGVLATAKMGTRLYAAGTEPFIGSVIQEALVAGIDHKSLITEHRGSAQRRVQCVHCKGFTEGVTTNPVTCSHCGLHLLVRDHYSRRLGAFMGVCIDVEDPSDLPKTEVLYP